MNGEPLEIIEGTINVTGIDITKPLSNCQDFLLFPRTHVESPGF